MLTLTLKLVDDNVNISAFNGTLANESKINFVGGIENIFSYLFLKNADLKIAGDLNSDWMTLDKFLYDTDNSSQTAKEIKPQAINLPNDIVVNINLNLSDLTFDRFHMRNFYSKVSYKNKALKKAKDIY